MRTWDLGYEQTDERNTPASPSDMVLDTEELYVESMREAMRSILLSFGTDPEEDVQTLVVPSSSRSTAKSVSATETFIGPAARAEVRRRQMAEYMRKRRAAERTDLSKYRFRMLNSGRYEMLSATDGERLRDKVNTSLAIASEVFPERRAQLVRRLDTLIRCVEAVYHKKSAAHSSLTRAQCRARNQRKLELCQALTKLINECSSRGGCAVAMEFDAWDTQLGEIETIWVSWYPEHEGREDLANTLGVGAHEGLCL